MTIDLFGLKYGAIMAIDLSSMDDIEFVADLCNKTEGIVAIKFGMIPILSINGGVGGIAKILQGLTDLPLIYDHQKMGITPPMPDDPAHRACFLDMHGMDGIAEGEFFGKLLGENGINAGIIYPLGGPKVQDSYTNEFRRNNVIPIILGRPTWDGEFQREGGIISDEVPKLIYDRASRSKVEYYIMPGNRPGETSQFVELVMDNLDEETTPKICLPGYGDQGGTVRQAFNATLGLPSYAIIGPCDCFDISDRTQVAEHVKKYCDEALSFL
jgi:hypothetical protein